MTVKVSVFVYIKNKLKKKWIFAVALFGLIKWIISLISLRTTDSAWTRVYSYLRNNYNHDRTSLLYYNMVYYDSIRYTIILPKNNIIKRNILDFVSSKRVAWFNLFIDFIFTCTCICVSVYVCIPCPLNVQFWLYMKYTWIVNIIIWF